MSSDRSWNRDEMLLAEVRYLGSNVGVFALLLVPIVASGAIGIAWHLPVVAAFSICIFLLCALGCAALTLWLRNYKRLESATPARYAPLIYPVVVLSFEAYWIVESIRQLQAAAWKDNSIGCFAVLCLSTGFFAISTLKDWDSRYLPKAPARPVPDFTQERLERFSTALELPDVPVWRRALRPLFMRAYVRLGLLLGEVVFMFVFAPYVGIGAALLISFAFVASLFLIGRKFFDL